MPRVTSPRVELRVAELARDHSDWGAPRIVQAIDVEFPPDADGRRAISQSKVGQQLPSLRRSYGSAEVWRLAPGEPDAEYVVGMMGYLDSILFGRSLPRRMVDWIRTVRAAAPYLDHEGVFRIAGLYMVTEARGHEAAWHALDAFLGQGLDPQRIHELWFGIIAPDLPSLPPS